MERGKLTLSGPFDLQATLESGQSYLWWRGDGADFDGTAGHDGWYLTTTRATGRPAVVAVRQRDSTLEWRSTIAATPVLQRRLGLADDLGAIRDASPDDDVIERAYDAYWGMRIVRDPPFGALISFICSAQMRVERIHAMQQRLRANVGTPVAFDGETYHAYPTPAQLAATSESTLRELSLGYRAPYVVETATMVADGEAPGQARTLEYERAREWLTRYVGVGQKVADCVLLFSLEFLEAVPLDTWIRKTIAEYFPDSDRGTYAATSRAIRERLGGTVAGYPQTYLFHYLRNRDAGVT